ncbi:MAG: exopolyphosphatase [Rhodobacteraceae bacterium]|nr:exopolyphosphatase [Paracoccaceae bacterium]
MRDPAFGNPAVDALSRAGVIDVGSNSVRFVVFDGAARSPACFYNEKVMCRLGAGLPETGRLNPRGRARALAALARFQAVATQICDHPPTAVATAALREAQDGPEFCAEVRHDIGLDLRIIDGLEEARLSAQGVLLGWPGSVGLVCDMGGASLEMARIGNDGVGRRLTLGLGPLKLRGLQGGQRGRRAYIDTVLGEAAAVLGQDSILGQDSGRLFLVGGSWRAIVRIDMERQNYPLRVLHGYRLEATAVRRIAAFIKSMPPEILRMRCGLSAGRLEFVPYALEVLLGILRHFRPREIALSSHGIREGLLYEQMPKALRRRDPLLEACRFAEMQNARLPGCGKVLFAFIKPLFQAAPPRKMRLINAACLLHDVHWQTNPDYRTQACLDIATRVDLGGLTHAERVFLGLALLHRYRSRRKDTAFAPLQDLVGATPQREAEILGKALRFGAMMWMRGDAPMGTLAWKPKKRHLRVQLPQSARALMSEGAGARLQSLVDVLGGTCDILYDSAT